MKRFVAICAVFVLLTAGMAFAAKDSKDARSGEVSYSAHTQAELAGDLKKYAKAKVSVKGAFLFTGSDFCYQVRKTTINTRDYLCFALGPMNLIRFYLKKDHEQVPQHGFVLLTDVVDRGDELVGNDQNVHGALRVDIAERRHALVLKHDIGRHFAADDFAENGFFGHC